MSNIKLNIYPNASVAKIKNRKVSVTDYNEGLIMEFVTLCKSKEDAEKPTTRQTVFRGKIRVTEVAISHEAAEALYWALKTKLNN